MDRDLESSRRCLRGCVIVVGLRIVVLATGINVSGVRVVDAHTNRAAVAVLPHEPTLVLVLLLCRGQKQQLDKLGAR
tara:strand:+ start:689 stop:919 length:231 start_codon:yes stop_codon:yes gene_type:complete